MSEELIEDFIAAILSIADLSTIYELDPIAWQLAYGESDEYGYKRWRPLRTSTDPIALEMVYSKLPARFPPLYEKLILSYRWAGVDLDRYRLLANPPGPDLSGLMREITKDKTMWDVLCSNGYLQFGKGPDVNYDPVCFDCGSRREDKDCRIVQLDHEEILCNNRVKEVDELAISFRELVLKTIEEARRNKAV